MFYTVKLSLFNNNNVTLKHHYCVINNSYFIFSLASLGQYYTQISLYRKSQLRKVTGFLLIINYETMGLTGITYLQGNLLLNTLKVIRKRNAKIKNIFFNLS
jgi:hypothetical protein